MTETHRINSQLKRAQEGQAWHGPSLRELLESVTAEQAAARPIPNAHGIWDSHIPELFPYVHFSTRLVGG